MGRDGGEGDESDASRAGGTRDERRATKAGIERATNARANARPRSAVVAAEASRRFPGFAEDAATTTARFAARVDAYKTEMTATLARVRLGLASDPREAAARLKADGSFRAESGAVPSTSLPAEPAVETFPPRAGVDGDESKVRAEAEAARRARDRNAFPGMENGDDDPGARAAALVAEASARARAALDQFARARSPGWTGRRPRRGPRRRRGGRAPPPRASPPRWRRRRRRRRIRTKTETTETKPASVRRRRVPSIARTSTSARRSTRTRRGRRETRERAENIARASRHSEVHQRPRPTKTKTASSSSSGSSDDASRARWVHVRGARGGASRAGRGCVGSRCSARGGCAAIDVALDRIFLTRKLCVDYEPPPRRGRA